MARNIDDAPVDLAHRCLVYEHSGRFEDEAAEHLAAGAARGERTVLLTRDDVRTHYERDGGFDPCGWLMSYAQAVRSARADGFSGVCIAADVSHLVTTPDRRRVFARYEHLVDRFIRRGGGLAGLCGYDATVIGEHTAAELAALHPGHPAGLAGPTSFHLYAADHPVDLVATGELDLAGRVALAEVLHAVAPEVDTDEIAIDVADLHFVDHRSLVMLDEYASRHEVMVTLQHATALMGRMIELLRLRRVRAEEWS